MLSLGILETSTTLLESHLRVCSYVCSYISCDTQHMSDLTRMLMYISITTFATLQK